MKTRNRAPTHPGVILRKIISESDGLSQEKLAGELSVSFQTINMLVNEKRSVSAKVAILLAKRFATTPQFWLNLQMAVDLYEANAAMQESA